MEKYYIANLGWYYRADDADAELTHLRARNAELERAYDAILDDCRIQEKRNAELEAEVARLRKALKGAKHFVPFLSGYYKAIEAALEASDESHTD